MLKFAVEVGREAKPAVEMALDELRSYGVPIFPPVDGTKRPVVLFPVYGAASEEPDRWVFFLYQEVSDGEELELARRMFPQLRIEGPA